MVPNIELIQSVLPSNMQVKAVRDGEAFQVSYKTLRGLTDTAKFLGFHKLMGALAEKEVDEQLIQVSLSFEDRNDSNKRVVYPTMFVNKQLSERQQQAVQASQNAAEVDALKAQLAQQAAMLAAMAEKLGVETPVVNNPEAPAENGPF